MVTTPSGGRDAKKHLLNPISFFPPTSKKSSDLLGRATNRFPVYSLFPATKTFVLFHRKTTCSSLHTVRRHLPSASEQDKRFLVNGTLEILTN
ncbi:hypothetical protein CDAR_440011 [Caerostris darwini]|uniref:Uncharacterized protein n=1 Tax=Caerostris darwini TaxID=1538125 RepID=A0AAV4SLB9_9ARAC|nr:hypothetical protein CDAR_440011 [Caerostris darwini]